MSFKKHRFRRVLMLHCRLRVKASEEAARVTINEQREGGGIRVLSCFAPSVYMNVHNSSIWVLVHAWVDHWAISLFHISIIMT